MFRCGHAGVRSIALRRPIPEHPRRERRCPSLTPASSAEPALEPWPIGAIVTAHWLAHRWGPEPHGPVVFEAVRLGLIDLSGHSSLTASWAEPLRQHGWR
jgi:hypothetical protein